MKLNKILGNRKWLFFLFTPFAIIFQQCTFTTDNIDCQGSIEGFLSAQVDNKQKGASLMEIKLPKLKMYKASNKDYFGLGIKTFDNRTTSYAINTTRITLFDNLETGIYSIILKTEIKDSLFILKFKSSIVKNIQFIGVGKNENFYFKIEQKSTCNKMYITPNYAMYFSEY